MPPKQDFNPEEKELLRQLARDRDRREWLAGILKRGAQWIVAVSLAVGVVWDWLGKVVKHFSGP